MPPAACCRMMSPSSDLGDELAVRQDAGALEHVAQLTHVPFPRRFGEQPLGRQASARRAACRIAVRSPGRTTRSGTGCPRAAAAAAAARSRRRSGGSRGRRGSGRRRLSCRQVAIGGGNQADVDLARFERTHTLNFAVLEHTQQLGLHTRRKFADLVEKDRSAVGGFEEARPCDRWRR